MTDEQEMVDLPDVTKPDELTAYVVDSFPAELSGKILKKDLRHSFEEAIKILSEWGWFRKSHAPRAKREKPENLKVGDRIKVKVRLREEGSKKHHYVVLEGVFIRWVPTGYAMIVDDNSVTRRGVIVEE